MRDFKWISCFHTRADRRRARKEERDFEKRQERCTPGERSPRSRFPDHIYFAPFRAIEALFRWFKS